MKTEVTSQSVKEKIKLKILPAVFVVAGFAFLGAGAYLFIKAQRPFLAKVVCPPIEILPQTQTTGDVDQRLTLSRLETLSSRVSQRPKEIGPATKKQIQQVQYLVRERKRVLLEAFRNNPDRATAMLFSPTDRRDLRQLSANCVEQPETVEGELEVLHADLFDQGESRYSYRLITAARQRLFLHPVGELPNLVSGTKIRVQGMRLDNDLLFSATPLSSMTNELGGYEQTPAPDAPSNANVGPDIQKTLVVLGYFRNTTPPTVQPATIQSIMANVSNYYEENSFDKVTFSGDLDLGQKADVVGWVQVDSNPSCLSWYQPDMNLALTAAKSQVGNLDFSHYSRFIWVGNFGTGTYCVFGAGTVGKTGVDTPDGLVYASATWLNPTANAYHFAHELGHNFGNRHAQYWPCGTQPNPPSSCVAVEYGDQYDVMGRGNSGSGIPSHFNAIHKENVGWLEPADIVTVMASGRYLIGPIESSSSTPKILKIRRGKNDYMYVEYRQPIGYDVGISQTGDGIYQGALLHTHPPSPSWLVKEPWTTVTIGQTWTDQTTGTTVTTVAATATTLTVDIQIGTINFPPAEPKVSFVSPTPYTRVSGNVTITANPTAEAGVDRVEFYYVPFTTFRVFATAAAVPYQGVLDTTIVPNGLIYIKAGVYDAAGQTGYDSGYGLALIVDNQDSVPPTVSVTSPSADTVTNTTVTMTVDATDNTGVWKVEFYKDDEEWPFAVSYKPPYQASPELAEGSHTLYAKAFDFVGNSTNSSIIPVIVDDTVPLASISAPTANSTINATARVIAQVTDNDQVARVQILNDDIELTTLEEPACDRKPEISFCGYFFDWDTTTVNNGSHALVVKAYDRAGNGTTSTVVPVIVNNGGDGEIGSGEIIPIKDR